MQTHSQRLEVWLGADVVTRMSDSMRDWYGPPIPLAGVPGNVYACAGGGFSGPINAGSEVSGLERVNDWLQRRARARRLLAGQRRKQAGMAGFTGFAELMSEARGGKLTRISFDKQGNTGVTSRSLSLWRRANGGGLAGAAAPSGTFPNSTTQGALGSSAPLSTVASETRHFCGGWAWSDAGTQSLLLYDRLFAVAKTMNSTATEAVTGVPTRYQSTTPSDPDYAGGNFLFVETGSTALAATAHNWTVCTYTDQDGNTGATLPSLLGISSGCPANVFDMGSMQWFAPLATGDSGIKALTQMQCDAAVATGLIDFTIGHPIAFLPIPAGNWMCQTDGIQTAFNLTRVFDDACLALIVVCAVSATGRDYLGQVEFVHS